MPNSARLSRVGGNPETIIDNLNIWTAAIENKAATGRGSNKKQHLYGIKKLRELILELAVRGLLVPQDPNDEPASVLLEKIAAEKAQLIKDGKIKKQKPLPAITDEEKPFDLPKGWEWSRIGNFSIIGPRNELEDNLEVSFVPMPLVTTSYKGEHGQEVRTWSELKKGYTHFADGDIGLAKITPCFENSKAAIFKGLINGYGAGTTELHIARPLLREVNSLFVLLYLKAPMFLEVGKTKMTGSAGQKRIPKSFFEGNPFPLPPEAEQPRIVAKVDELMALCDELEQQTESSLSAHNTLVDTLLASLLVAAQAFPGHAQSHSHEGDNLRDPFQQAWQRIWDNFDVLFTTESSIDQLKQTILQLAVMGKLVPQDPNDEPASVLLEKIAAEKAQLIKEGKIKKQKPLPEMDLENKLVALPSGWTFEYMQNISKVVTCGMASTPKYYDEGRIFLSAKNVKPNKFMPEDHKFVDEDTFRKITQNAFPEKGDILLTRVGAGIGEAAVIDREMEFAFYVSLTLLKPFLDYFNSYYLLIWLNSPEGVKKSLDNVYGAGVSQGNLNVNQVRAFEVPIAPLNEQNKIVAKVDELMALCEALKERLRASQTTQLHLANAMAEQALS